MSEIAIAQNRFGLGARTDKIATGDAKLWLKNQFQTYRPSSDAIAALPDRQQIALGVAKSREGTFFDSSKNSLAKYSLEENSSDKTSILLKNEVGKQGRRKQINAVANQYYQAAVAARVQTALQSETPFVEHLIHFWANHFAVSAKSFMVRPYAGLLEFEAIRPHVLGNFSDMLLAVEQHPAMLIYLNQVDSFGPNSPIGKKPKKQDKKSLKINEDLARIVLEMHTVGQGVHYTQENVSELAKAFTGWAVVDLQNSKEAEKFGRKGQPGAFIFSELMHEPGTRQVMEKQYPQTGVNQAQAILKDLAIHPATAKHIATKLSRHFVADDPPAALVEKLSQTFLKTNGNLIAVYQSLIDAPESWQSKATKFKTPWEWLISSLRALNTKNVQSQSITALNAQLGQPVWKSSTAAGYDDIAASWTGPNALIHRVEVAELLATRSGQTIDPRILAPKLLDNQLSGNTIQAIAQADSSGQGVALMLVSPEFLRR